MGILLCKQRHILTNTFWLIIKERYSYNEGGLMEAMVDGEGFKTSYMYAHKGRLITTVNPDGTTEPNTYDAMGRLETKTLAAAPETKQASTDTLSGSILYTYTYTYDQWGNITGINCQGEVEDDHDLTGMTQATMTYDKSNRMVTYNGEEILYDADDVRIAVETPEYRDEYVTDSVTALSRVLEVERTYKLSTSTPSDIATYYYGNGLSYEKNSLNGMLVYHYDHLGSTKVVTDKEGNIVQEYTYGTYGELLSDDEMDIYVRFLYNGQYGVITDDNSLYYMRSRYYNPQIKRFINQDILTGNIGNSQSLNRYSYVEGNPVSYTDPFGLSPILHGALDLWGIWFPPADFINAGIYALEGNGKEVAKSVVYAIPGMDLFKVPSKFVKAGTKGYNIAKNTTDGISIAGTILSMFAGAEDIGCGVAGMIDKYGVYEEEVSAETALEVAILTISAGQLFGSAHYYSKDLGKLGI